MAGYRVPQARRQEQVVFYRIRHDCYRNDMRIKPSVWLYSGDASGRHRWYPHEALGALVNSIPFKENADFRWDVLDPEDASELLPELRERLRYLAQFLKMIESIADDGAPTICHECSSRFYPSRSDAKYCADKCRTRAYRKRLARQ